MDNPRCHRCGEDLFQGDRFCAACGAKTPHETGPQSAFPTPGSTRVDFLTDSTAGPAANCRQCGEPLFPKERFCPACGRFQGTVESEPQLGASEAGWAEILQRLRNATAGEYEIIRVLGRGGMNQCRWGSHVRGCRRAQRGRRLLLGSKHARAARHRRQPGWLESRSGAQHQRAGPHHTNQRGGPAYMCHCGDCGPLLGR